MSAILDLVAADGIDSVLADTPPEHHASILALFEEELYAWSCGDPLCSGDPHEHKPYPHARPEQLPPLGDWLLWLILAGRGAGKTRTGGEFVKDGHPQSLMRLPGCRAALVAETFADGRDTMVEGESGLLSILPPSALRGGNVSDAWNRSLGELYLANGSKAKIYSSEKPGQLRGPQHHIAWGDEPAKWKDSHLGDAEDTTWSNLLLGLRLGADPRIVLTGTPKRVRLLVGTNDRPGILSQDTTHLTRGSTYDNLANLAPTFRAQILRKYEGTRLGRQELHAEILEDVEGALWARQWFEDHRRSPDAVPDLDRVVVAVDPAVTATAASDETGIVAAGRAGRGAGARGYVLADRSFVASPAEWGKVVCLLAVEVEADAIVYETNQGGDMVAHVIKGAWADLRASSVVTGPRPRLVGVHASRGKVTRAEPIAAQFEQGRWSMAGAFQVLEDECCSWVPGDPSPDRLDALVWAGHELMVDAVGMPTPPDPAALRRPLPSTSGSAILAGRRNTYASRGVR